MSSEELLMFFIADLMSAGGKISKNTALMAMGYIGARPDLQAAVNATDKKAIIEHRDSASVDKVTFEMINAAIKKAVETKILPEVLPIDAYELHWQAMEEIIKAAVGAGE